LDVIAEVLVGGRPAEGLADLRLDGREVNLFALHVGVIDAVYLPQHTFRYGPWAGVEELADETKVFLAE
jgi:hypothetical protein